MSEMSPEVEARIAAKLQPAEEPEIVEDEAAQALAAAAATTEEAAAGGETTETAETTDPPADETQLIFGKYKTMEEAERGLQHLESKLGEQGSELGQTRQELERLRTQFEQSSAPQYDSDRLEDWLDENVAYVPQVAEQARQRGDGALFDAAMEKWYDVAPRQAAQYERQLEMAQLRTELGTTTAELTAPAQALQQREAQQAAVSSLRGKFEDFADVMGAMDEGAISEILSDPLFPSELLAHTKPGDVAAQERLLGTLYAFAKTRQVGPISEVAQTAARTAQTEARDVKRSGTLPAASGSGTHEAAPDAARQFKSIFRSEFGLPPLES